MVVLSAVPLRSETLKSRIVETLSDRLDSDVVLDDLTLRVFPRLHAEATGLSIRRRGAGNAAPLISIKTFVVDADLLGVWRRHVAHVGVGGLVISIPPKDDADAHKNDDERKRPHRLHDGRGRPVADPPAPDSPPANADAKKEAAKSGHGGPTEVVIDVLDASDAKLVIVPRESNRVPKVWAIHQLRMRRLSAFESMPYEATLTNGVPPGEIKTSGDFGPWNRDDPGATPLNGTFTFDNADLSVFNGIAGTLSSKGSFDGSLGWIDVNGETDTPNFVIQVGGHPFPLHTKYHSIVDGTNGDTRLERIDAQFLKSSLVAKGAVLDGPPGQDGRTVTLDVDMQKARIEDIMHMAVKTTPAPLVGGLKLTTKFLLPPGKKDVVDRLQLNGHFQISSAKFSDPTVQSKILELSRRGRGKVNDTAREQVASDFRGRFILGGGQLQLPELAFAVPGAQVRLAGKYGLKSEQMQFAGNLLLDAKISQTVTGFKSVLLKIVDPLFGRPGGGSSIPIKIEGSRTNPKFGLDFGRVFKGDGK
jgi:hypothetical protein